MAMPQSILRLALPSLILLVVGGCRTRRQAADQPYDDLLDAATMRLEDGTTYSEAGPVRVASKYYTFPTLDEVVAKLAAASDEALPAVLSATEDADENRAAVAFWVLSRQHNPSGLPAALRRIGTGNAFLATATADYVGELRSKDAVVPLIRRLRVPQGPATGAAARALGKIGDPLATPCLISLLGKRSLDDDESIAGALAKIADSSAIPPLRKRRQETERLLSERRRYREDEQLQRNLFAIDEALTTLSQNSKRTP